MKVNPNYLGRLFTEKELTEEERQEAVRLPAMRKEKGKLFCQRCNSLILEEWYLSLIHIFTGNYFGGCSRSWTSFDL